MQLSKALRVEPGRTIAFVGAGGKTSAIRSLTNEIASRPGDERNWVIVTTTTRLGADENDLAPSHLIDPSEDQLNEIPALLAQHRSVMVTGPELEGKWIPPKDGALNELQRIVSDYGAYLLVEADGARRCSVKAPADHEPVIPHFTDLVVPMAGLDALGQSIKSEAVHRPEIVARVVGKSRGTEIGPNQLAKLLSDTRGGLKGVPEGAEVRVLLNKLDATTLDSAREIAQTLLASSNIKSVLLGSVASDDPIQEAHGRVAGVVLAAGGSLRLGEPKQLITWRGHPLVWQAVQAAGSLQPRVVVIGEAAQNVRRALKTASIDVIENEEWESGQSSSVRLGLEAVSSGTEAVIFLLGDMPFVGADLIHALVERHRQTLAHIVATRAGGRRANPVLFDLETYPDLLRLEGDRGGRAIFHRYDQEYVEWEDSILLDIDTPEDRDQLLQMD